MEKTDTNESKDYGSAFDLIGKSVEIVKRNWQMFAVVNILALISAVAATFQGEEESGAQLFNANAVESILENRSDAVFAIAFIITIVLIIFALFLATMALNLELRSSRGEKPSFDELFDAAKKYWLRYFGLLLLIVGIVGIGLVLLILPGLFAFYRLCMAPYLMMDKDLDIVSALKASNTFVSENSGPVLSALVVFILVMLGTALFGILPIIGPALSTAASIAVSLVLVLRYRQIQGLPIPNSK
jgi:uncharacterized membrane protein